MEINRYRRRLAVVLALAALPIFSIAAAPASLAGDCDWDVGSLDCMMDSDDGFGSSGGFQPGNLVIPADGGPPQVAAAPAPDGGPVVTAGGDVVIPGAPPIG